jgi:hypothetical protein
MHFCKIENNIVVDVLLATQEFIDSGALGDPNNFILSENMICAAVGSTYDPIEHKFVPPELPENFQPPEIPELPLLPQKFPLFL